MARRLDEATAADFAAARLLAVNAAPYLAAGLYRLAPVETRGLKTLAVDASWRVYVDPDAIAEWGVEATAGVLVHELSHVLRSHHARFANDDPKKANVSGDLEINDDISLFGLTLPDGCLHPHLFGFPEGLLAEQYFDLLPENMDGGGQDGDPQPGDGQPGGTPSPGNQPGTGQARDPQDQSGGQGQPTFSPEQGCGSGASGGRRDYELDPDDADAPGLGEGEAENVRAQVAHATADYIRNHGRGSVPAGLARWVDTALAPPTVSWRRHIRAAMRRAVAHKAGQVDFTYRKPGRRRVERVVTASMQRPVPAVVVVIDTSGSVGPAQLHAAVSEVQGMARRVGLRGSQLQIIACDAAAARPIEWRGPKSVEQLAGGGGTDMRVGIAAAEAMKPNPSAIVVLTDGYTPWPSTPTKAKLIVGLLGEGCSDSAPAWATTVQVDLAA